MREPATQFPCPVCIGAKLDELRLEDAGGLDLDHCRRCGGVWFDEGEVARLRRYHPRVLRAHITLQRAAYRHPCPTCGTPMDRNRPFCPACRSRNVIDCPGCGSSLTRITQHALVLDACKKCRGIWFDAIDLASIWNEQFSGSRRSARSRYSHASLTRRDNVAYIDAVDGFYLVSMMGDGVEVGAGLVGAVGEVAGSAIASAPDVAGAAFEGVGSVASTIFEVVAEIIGGIFS